jgi:hypothetical protein
LSLRGELSFSVIPLYHMSSRPTIDGMTVRPPRRKVGRPKTRPDSTLTNFRLQSTLLERVRQEALRCPVTTMLEVVESTLDKALPPLDLSTGKPRLKPLEKRYENSH